MRNVGKRNKDLNKKAIKIANDLIKLDSKTATWIAKDTLKELQGKKVNILNFFSPEKFIEPNKKQ